MYGNSMDCASYVKQIVSKHHSMVTKYESVPDANPGEVARSSSDFIEWLETVIKNGVVEDGEQTISGKVCILKFLSETPDGEEVDDLYECLSLFSDFRIKELLGVSIFSE